MSSLRTGARDSLLLALGALATAGLGLVSLRLLLSGLSEEDYGHYALFLTAGGLLAVALSWPLHAVLRLGAEEAEAGGRGGRTLGSVGLVVVGCAAIVAPLTWLLGARIDAEVGRPAWRLALLFALLTAAASLGYQLLQPFGKNHLRTLLPALPRCLFALTLAVVTWGGAQALDFERAAWLATLTIAPVVALGPWIVQPGAPRPERREVARTLGFGLPLLARNLGVAGVLFVDVLIVRRWLGPVAAGRYDVAYRIGEQVVAFGFVLTFLSGPILARAAARGDRGALERFYRLGAPPLVWLWGLGAALGIVVAEPLLRLLGAKSPGVSAAVLQVLLLAVAIRGAAVLEIAVFEAHLLSRWPTLFFFLGFLLNLVLDLVLLRAGWGLLGPAWATVAGFALQAVLRAGYIQRGFGVPALAPYLALLPVAAVLVAARLGGLPLAAALWLLSLVLVLGWGRRTRLFSRDARALLAEVAMPARLRAGLDWLHAGPSHEEAS